MGKLIASALEFAVSTVSAVSPGTPSSGFLRLYAKGQASGSSGDRLLVKNSGGVVVDLCAVVPVGTIMMWPTSTPPSNWLVCDGSGIPSTNPNYSDLISLIGGGLPDLRGLFPIGVDGSHALLSTGGALSKALVEANVPNHTHNVAHTHDVPSRANATIFGAQGRAAESGGAGGTTPNFATTASSNATSGTGTGSGTAVDITPPWRGLYFIIYAGRNYP